MSTETHELEGDADDTRLIRPFGSGARMTVTALLGEDGTDLDATTIARLAGVARSTVDDHIDERRRLSIVEQTRNIGDSPMYRFSADDTIGECVAELESVTLRRLLERDGALDG
ncbi:ArsR family transcriptional regulator [Halobacteriales archaeon QS_4_69_34]|nr:MAG: ArsR family transcriptional regulator [Halobacteriales archaeon QS_4_69_34]